MPVAFGKGRFHQVLAVREDIFRLPWRADLFEDVFVICDPAEPFKGWVSTENKPDQGLVLHNLEADHLLLISDAPSEYRNTWGIEGLTLKFIPAKISIQIGGTLLQKVAQGINHLLVVLPAR